jgi:uncharacterized protein (DUF58 family)
LKRRAFDESQAFDKGQTCRNAHFGDADSNGHLAMRLKLIPSRTSVWTLTALALLCALALVFKVFTLSAVIFTSTVLAVAMLTFAAADVFWSLRTWYRAPLQWRRRLPAAFALGVTRQLSGQLINEGVQRWRVALFDHVDPSLTFNGLPQTLQVPAQKTLEVHYSVTPSQRGEVCFAPAELRVRTLLGSFELLLKAGAEERLRVYPNFAAVSRYAWLAGDNRLAEIGIKAAPQRGAGTDFKQLSEYKPGDSIRHIDWKATLRHKRAIVREYQDERDQTVLFLLDCGRRMRADEGTNSPNAFNPASTVTSHFDEALNALILLAHVALKEGDAVGVMTFGCPPGEERHFAPRKGIHSLNALMASIYDIQPQAVHSDYLMAAAELMRLQRKRALIVILTNFRDEDSAEIEPALRLMRGRHLVLLASLRERVLRELMEQPLTHESVAIEVAGAHLFTQSRHDAFTRLSVRDGLLVDVEPGLLPAQLVNRYRALKRAGLL